MISLTKIAHHIENWYIGKDADKSKSLFVWQCAECACQITGIGYRPKDAHSEAIEQQLAHFNETGHGTFIWREVKEIESVH